MTVAVESIGSGAYVMPERFVPHTHKEGADCYVTCPDCGQFLYFRKCQKGQAVCPICKLMFYRGESIPAHLKLFHSKFVFLSI